MYTLDLNPEEFREFIAILEFILDVKKKKNPKKVVETTKVLSKSAEFAEVFGSINARSVYNALYKPDGQYPRISEKWFKSFELRFKDLNTEGLDIVTIRLHKAYHDRFERFTAMIHKRITSKNFHYSKIITTTKSGIRKSDEGNNSLGLFENTEWYCYERDDNKLISRKILRFGSIIKEKYCEVSLTVSKNGQEKWTGEAEFNNNEGLLIIVLKNSTSGFNYTHFLIKVENTSNHIELCIGHKTFRNKERNNVVSKTVVMSLIPDKAETPSYGQFILTDPAVPEPIRKFLDLRVRNRLSSPHAKPIYNLETFEAWAKQNRPMGISGTEALVGTYWVFYRIRPKDPNWQTDKLELTVNENGQLQAKYSHEVYQGESKDWVGNAHPNYETKTMTLYLKEQSSLEVHHSGEATSSDNPIFLMINIPPRNLKKVDTLTGVAAASRDGDRGSVGRLMVLVKEKDASLPEAFDLKKLKGFFDYFADRSWVRPPVTSKVPVISQFNHLEDARTEAVDRRKKASA